MFFKDLGLGSKNFFKAINFMFKHGLWWYYLIPLVISTLLLFGSLVATAWVVEWVQAVAQEFFELPVDPDVTEGFYGLIEGLKMIINSFREVFITVLIWSVKILIFYYFGKYIVLIILSPVLAYLSEKVEGILTGTTYPFEILQFVREVWRGVLVALRNMIFEGAIIIGCWVLTWIFPFILPFTAIFLFFVGAYYYGFSMMDYVNERKRSSISQSVRYIRKNKGVAIGNGSIFAVLMLIPFVGPIFAPITASVGAVLAIHEKGELGSQYARSMVSSVQPLDS